MILWINSSMQMNMILFSVFLGIYDWRIMFIVVFDYVKCWVWWNYCGMEGIKLYVYILYL